MDVATTRQLAGDYTAAVDDLNGHWPAGNGGCVCGAAVSPCDGEVEAMRRVTAAEAAWRAEGERLREGLR